MQTQDNQLSKGTRVAVLYSYSDVIYVLRPFAKYECGPNSFDPDGTGPLGALLICTTNRGHDCRYPGAVCGVATSNSISRKTKFLFCY